MIRVFFDRIRYWESVPEPIFEWEIVDHPEEDDAIYIEGETAQRVLDAIDVPGADDETVDGIRLADLDPHLDYGEAIQKQIDEIRKRYNHHPQCGSIASYVFGITDTLERRNGMALDIPSSIVSHHVLEPPSLVSLMGFEGDFIVKPRVIHHGVYFGKIGKEQVIFARNGLMQARFHSLDYTSEVYGSEFTLFIGEKDLEKIR